MKINFPPLVRFNAPAGNSHVLGDRCVADGVGRGGDGGLAAVAAAAAVQAGHVHAVQVVVVLPPAVAQGLVLAVVVASADITQHCKNTTTRGTPSSIQLMTKEH